MGISARRDSDGHMPQLDGLRAIAVFAVIMQHTLDQPMVTKLELGWGGVYLFFVMSGFLITGILLRARRAAESTQQNRGRIMLAFYARRFLRIFPLYYGVLALAILIGIPEAVELAAWHLSYLTNVILFLQLGGGGSIAHFWSLAVEEQFYLVWPALVLFLPRRALGPVFIVLIVFAPLFRAVVILKTINIFVGHLTPSCLDSLGLGSLLALLWQSREQADVRVVCRWCLAIGLLMLILVKSSILLGPIHRLLQIFFTNTSLALIFVWFVNGAAVGFRGPLGWFLSCRPMVYLGTISYGIYVWQMFAAVPSPVYMDRLYPYYPSDFGFSRLLLVGVFSIFAATISWFLYEKPINSLKRYFPYLRKTSGATIDSSVQLKPD